MEVSYQTAGFRLLFVHVPLIYAKESVPDDVTIITCVLLIFTHD